MPVTTDPNDPRLGHGTDSEPKPQNEAYLVLSDEERAKGFVRPLRFSYRHVGKPAPKYPLIDIPDEYKDIGHDYVKWEPYPEGSLSKGRFWTQEQINAINNGCGELTIMARPIAETYARNPGFYGATYCMHCQKHLPVEEFVWEGTDQIVGS